MAKLTDLSTELFGNIGVYDPEVMKTGIAIKRVVDFSQVRFKNESTGAMDPLGNSKNYEFMKIPSGFVMTGVYFEEMLDDDNAKCNSGNLTLKTVEDPTKTIGAAVTVGGSTLAKTFMKPVAASGSSVNAYVAETSAGSPTKSVVIPPSAAADLMFVADDMLCIKASASMSQGRVAIVVHGYLMDGGSLNADKLEVPYREGQTEADFKENRSSGDLYLKKVAAK